MNKLYCIKFLLSNGYVISVFNTWSAADLKSKIEKNPEWKFELVEDNPIHCIYEAR